MVVGMLLGMCKCSEVSPNGNWGSNESPDGEELFYILEGSVEFTLLGDGVAENVNVGEMFIVPRRTWHRQVCDCWVIAMGATTGRTEHSTAEDPRPGEYA